MKMRILAALLAATVLLGGVAYAADTEATAPSADSDAADTPTDTPVVETVTPSEIPAPTADANDGVPTETPPTETITPNAAYGEYSSWFGTELAEANSLGLIPSRFGGADMRATMTRAEFAAVAVKVYEKMSGTTVAIPAANPFTDTTDADVLRAYSAGIVNGVSTGVFAPNDTVTRQQVATMLTRIFKALNWPGWTLAGDATYSAHGLDYGGVTLYADDAAIYDYAFPSVYFLTKYGITNGTGNNCFEPNSGCTREQGVALALRLYKVFG